jgi:hypothetical protein
VANRLQANSQPNNESAAEPKVLATFLAQLIAQERLPQGLHHPPIRAADIAYRQAGAAPPAMPLVRLSV